MCNTRVVRLLSICQLSCTGPLLVVGDLNAHLGYNGSSGLRNSRGCMWNKIIEEQSLLNLFASELHTGPMYTHSLCGNYTTLDYILCNLDASRGLIACCTLKDHLPVSCSIYAEYLRVPPQDAFPSSFLDWKRAQREGGLFFYSQETDDIVRSLLNKDYSSVDVLNFDILSVAEAIKKAASVHIPSRKKKSTNPNKFYD